jgi:hypothetical protein
MAAAQPDFGVIAGGFVELSQQFSRCVNLPAVQGGDAILEELRAMRADVGQLNDAVLEVNLRLREESTARRAS